MNTHHQPEPSESREARLTAYALGELGPEEREAVEAELARSEHAQRTVHAIHIVAQHLREACRAIPTAPSESLRAAIEARLAQPDLSVVSLVARSDQSSTGLKPVRRAWRARVAWAFVATSACVMIGVMLQWIRGGSVVRPDDAQVAIQSPSVPESSNQTGSGQGTAPASGLGVLPAGERGVAVARGSESPTGSSADARPRQPALEPQEPQEKDPLLEASAKPRGRGHGQPQSAPETAPQQQAETDLRGVVAVAESNQGAARPERAPASAQNPAPRLARNALTRSRHLPARQPWFLAPRGASGPILTTVPSESPEAIPRGPAGQASQDHQEPDSAVPGRFGADRLEPARPTEGGKPPESGDTHLALPPGMQGASGPASGAKKPGKPLPGAPQSPSPRKSSDTAADAGPTDSGFVSARWYPFSAFSLEVHSEGYRAMERFLRAGYLPRPDQVPVEEIINAFPYDYQDPIGDLPVAIHIEATECPWNRTHRLVRIGIAARKKPAEPAGPLASPQDPSRPPVVARNVQVQVEFRPEVVLRYRLIGYDDTPLPPEERDALEPLGCDMRAGHTATALYEVVVAPSASANAADRRNVKTAGKHRADPIAADSRPILLTVYVRYQRPTDEAFRLVERPFVDVGQSFVAASPDFRFAAAAAAFGLILRQSESCREMTLQEVEQIAASAAPADASGQRARFVELVRIARRLTGRH